MNGAPYVQFAKNSGMTCGVQEDLVAAAPEQKRVEPPAPKRFSNIPIAKSCDWQRKLCRSDTAQNPINDAKAVAAVEQRL